MAVAGLVALTSSGMVAMRRRVLLALAGMALAVSYALARSGGPASGLRVAANTTSQAAGVGSDVSRIALVAIAVVAVAAFTVLQVIARARCGRDGGPPSWPS
jgi:hypothetical protein